MKPFAWLYCFNRQVDSNGEKKFTELSSLHKFSVVDGGGNRLAG